MTKKIRMSIPGVRKTILIVSGKGGVGKSTIAANLALTLSKKGLNVGLLDTDIYGPSIPRIFAIYSKPNITRGQFIPLNGNGIKLMSIGFLFPEDTAIIWRGPMITKALHKLLLMTKWDDDLGKNLDYLIVDTPPGTGDIHLTLFSNYKIDSAIVVSTPQILTVIDAFKTVNMLNKLEIKVLGFIENMSYLVDNKDEKKMVFGHSKLKKYCLQHNIPILSALPISVEVAENYFFPKNNSYFQNIL